MKQFITPLPFNPTLPCHACRTGLPATFEFTMAFQPIVDLAAQRVFGYEALVRGPNQQTAGSVLDQVNGENVYAFDRACRVRAIELASSLGLPASEGLLSINFIPGAVYRPEVCIRSTLEAASRFNFPLERIVFEVTEGEQVSCPGHLKSIFCEYKRQGFHTAIDDFGAGFAGLNLLAEFQPDIVKLDMALTRNIDSRQVSRLIVKSVIDLCVQLGCKVIAEGVETAEESDVLRDLGITLFQGNLFAWPAVETLPTPLYR